MVIEIIYLRPFWFCVLYSKFYKYLGVYVLCRHLFYKMTRLETNYE